MVVSDHFGFWLIIQFPNTFQRAIKKNICVCLQGRRNEFRIWGGGAKKFFFGIALIFQKDTHYT